MPVKVVDASAIGALVFGEPTAEAVAAKLAGATLAAPALLGFEMANIAVPPMTPAICGWHGNWARSLSPSTRS